MLVSISSLHSTSSFRKSDLLKKMNPMKFPSPLCLISKCLLELMCAFSTEIKVGCSLRAVLSIVCIKLLPHMMMIRLRVYFHYSQCLGKTGFCPINIIPILCLKTLYKQLINFRSNKLIH